MGKILLFLDDKWDFLVSVKSHSPETQGTKLYMGVGLSACHPTGNWRIFVQASPAHCQLSYVDTKMHTFI